jgi:short-subunit dehydrogenase
MNAFNNKTVLITGGTDGIGKELVLQFLELGAKVVTCGRSQQKILALESESPVGNLSVINADVSNEKDCERMVNHAITQCGSIDILINNAGISMRGLLEESGPALIPVIKKVMDINFNGSLYITSYALKYLIQSKGTIVGISSIAGYRGLPGRSGYSASKFALQGWLEALKTELLDKGVHVMWISPGYTKSSIRNEALIKDGENQGESPLDESKLMKTDDCARLIIGAIKDKKRSLVMTFQGKQTVFLNKFFPGLTDKLVHGFFFKKGKLIK